MGAREEERKEEEEEARACRDQPRLRCTRRCGDERRRDASRCRCGPRPRRHVEPGSDRTARQERGATDGPAVLSGSAVQGTEASEEGEEGEEEEEQGRGRCRVRHQEG